MTQIDWDAMARRASAKTAWIIEQSDRENAARVGRGEPCKHRYEFRAGTTVELGSDAGWFCRRCGKERT